jgi:hypothetical protein
MKNKTYFISSFLCLLILALLVASCKKADDRHRQFFENGETIYIAKADSLRLRGGLNRIELSWLLLSDPKIYKYKLYWNNRKDSIVNIVQKTNKVDTVRMMLKDMKEGTYFFEIFTFDKDGNTSVAATGTGKVYGENYQNSLLPRTYRSARRLGDGVEFNWTQAEETLQKVELSYVDIEGKTIHKIIPKLAELDTLYDFPNAGTFKYRSLFLPDTNALDTFYTELKTYKVNTTITNWNDYSIIFGHYNYLVARTASGELVRFPNNGTLGFQSPVRISTGWNIYDMIMSYQTAAGIVYRVKNIGAGSLLHRAPLNAEGTLGTGVQLGSGWQGFDLVFGYESMLITRAADVFKRYPVNTSWALTPANTVITGIQFPTEYIKMCAALNGLYGVSPDGKLWNIPLAKEFTAVAQARRQVATGWNQYDLVSTFQKNLIARKPNGEMWLFPIEANGNVGVGTLMSTEMETWK